MKVRVLFFSVLRDITGCGEIMIELPSPEPRVSTLLEALFVRWPRLREWDRSLLVAIDQTYARRDAVLHPDAEVAFMPPVQGG